MHAIRLHEYGPAQNLRWETVDDPTPGPGQVAVEVAAAGVHLIETWVRGGRRLGGRLPTLPWTPGNEVAGRVVAVGPGADPAWVGTEVAARMDGGGYATRAVAAVEAVVPVPAELSAADAVALIGTGATAMAIADLAALAPDDVVLVTAAAGGIGTLLVQLVKAAGATVIGAAGGPAKAAVVREAGADLAVDYDTPDWTAALGRAVTVVLDGVGGRIAEQACRLLEAGGRVVTFGSAAQAGEPSPLAVPPGVTVETLFGAPVVERLRDPAQTPAVRGPALAAGARGLLHPVVTMFPLRQAAAAHAALEARGTTGKVVLVAGG
jgi:NADPH2:quinone reductase